MTPVDSRQEHPIPGLNGNSLGCARTSRATRASVTVLALAIMVLGTSQAAIAQAPTPDCTSQVDDLSPSSDWPERARALAADSFAALFSREAAPGAAIAVVVDGRPAWRATLGQADPETGRPVCVGTPFRTGSVSKVLTALTLLRAVEAGVIDLDADVRTLVPAVSWQPHEITLRQLAGHLGGIRHYRSAAEYLNTRRYERVSDALAVFADDSLVSLPGTEYRYSSYGFNLLGAAIGNATEAGYVESVRRFLLEPLGLGGVSPEASAAPDALARPFSTHDGDLVPSPLFDPSDRVPSGGWVASAEELARIGYALVDPGFLTPASRELLLESQRTDAGEETGTSIGLRVGRDAGGRRILHHGGTSVGARAFLLVYPDEGVSVAVLMNGPGEFAEEAVGRIAEPFLRR